jgi:hypothetical protein
MNFDRLDIATDALTAAQHDAKSESDLARLSDTMNENLMAALMNNKPDFVRLYLDHGAEARSVSARKKPVSELKGEGGIRGRTESPSPSHRAILLPSCARQGTSTPTR